MHLCKKEVIVLYILSNVVERIKTQAKIKKKSTTKMLENCDLSKNTLFSMNTRGSWILANNLAVMADYLDCSVDYLLGRTDNPESHKIQEKNTIASNDEQLAAVIDIYEKLDIIGKARLLVAMDDILKGKFDK